MEAMRRGDCLGAFCIAITINQNARLWEGARMTDILPLEMKLV
jgi:hypothetical protein